MGKQGEIPGTERPKVQEVEDAAEVYVKSMKKRVKASKEEATDKEALIATMRKHKLTVYAIPDEGIVVTIGEGKPTVKITESRVEESDEEEEEKPAKKAPPKLESVN